MATINTPIIKQGNSPTQQISHSSSTNIHRLHNWVFLTEAGKTAKTEFVSFDNVTIKITDDGTNRFLTVYLAGHNLIKGSIFNLTSVNPTTNSTYFTNNPTFTVTTVVNTAVVQVNLGNVLLNLGSFTASVNYTRTVSYTSADIGKRCRVVENNTFYDLVSFDVSNAPVWVNAHGASTLQSEGDLISTALAKTTPVDTDQIGLMDSSASNILKKLSWANIKVNLKSYFDSIYQTVLVSGTSIKTINNTSILGAGDITISSGSSNLTGFTNSTYFNNCIGQLLQSTNAGTYNTSLGYSCLTYNANSSYNIALGAYSLGSASITGGYNIAMGSYCLYNNTSGVKNTAIGSNNLVGNTAGAYNVAIGTNCAGSNSLGNNNVAIGFYSLTSNANGNNNIAIGSNCISASNCRDNVVIGNNCLNGSNPSGNNNNNVVIGINSMRGANGGFDNIALGTYALSASTYASGYNIAIGLNSSYNLSSGTNNIAIGQNALISASNLYDSVAIGYNASYSATGSRNVCIGANAGYDALKTLTVESDYVIIGNFNTNHALVKVAWTIGSDGRDKTNISPLVLGLDFVNQLKPSKFNYTIDRESKAIAEGSRLRYGFIAQDILELEKEPVIVNDSNPDFLTLNETALIPVLVNAIKELTARIELLEAKIN